MTIALDRRVVLAVGLALLMHGLLFLMARPNFGGGLSGVRVPPSTHYMVQSAEPFSMEGSDVRTIRSPVMFSLPSEMGFSRFLHDQEVRTRLTFSQPVEAEYFLDIPALEAGKSAIRSVGLPVMSLSGNPGPGVPVEHSMPSGNRPSARQLAMDPELRVRMDGSIVLPAELKQAVEKPWEVRASLHISEEGVVEHVLLDKPLEYPALNQQVIRLLYSLHFTAGNAVDASIEIFSPDPLSNARDELK